MSTFRELCLERTRPIVTAEFPSIDGGDLQTVQQLADGIAPWVDAMNVTDNPAAHAHASNTAVAIALKQLGCDPILQVVCRDKNRLAIQADIVGVSLFGVENLCALTGDDVTAGDEPGARRVFDLDGPQLIHLASVLAGGHYLSGRSVKSPPNLFIGAVENPTAPPQPYRIDRAAMKIDTGARFLQLQIGYEPDVLATFMAGCLERGLCDRAAFLPTVCLTRGARALEFMNEQVPGIQVPQQVIDQVAQASDESEAAYELVRDLASYALALPGVAGLHITDFRHDGSLERLVSDLRIGPAHS
jgi:methylenetetrahydrofolate reductase (NADPH)